MYALKPIIFQQASTNDQILHMRDCEKILSLCCDSAFVYKKEFSIFKFTKRFLEISCRDFTSVASLTTLF